MLISYGEEHDNKSLLFIYGFALPSMTWDVVDLEHFMPCDTTLSDNTRLILQHTKLTPEPYLLQQQFICWELLSYFRVVGLDDAQVM